jgi:hypothetical protein
MNAIEVVAVFVKAKIVGTRGFSGLTNHNHMVMVLDVMRADANLVFRALADLRARGPLAAQ